MKVNFFYKKKINLEDLHSEFIKLSYLYIEILLEHTNCLYILKIYNKLHYDIIEKKKIPNHYYYLIIEYNLCVIKKLLSNVEKKCECVENVKESWEKYRDYVISVLNVLMNEEVIKLESEVSEERLLLEVRVLKENLRKELKEEEREDNRLYYNYISYMMERYKLEEENQLEELIEKKKEFEKEEMLEMLKRYERELESKK